MYLYVNALIGVNTHCERSFHPDPCSDPPGVETANSPGPSFLYPSLALGFDSASFLGANIVVPRLEAWEERAEDTSSFSFNTFPPKTKGSVLNNNRPASC